MEYGRRLIRDIENISKRLSISDRLPNRSDIRDHAATLISWQDNGIATADLVLNEKEHEIGQDISLLLAECEYPEDEVLPKGSKQTPLFFSPLPHLHRAIRADPADTTSATLVPQLPKAASEIEEYLQEAMNGVFKDDTAACGTFCAVSGSIPRFDEHTKFEKVTGVTISSIASFLEAIRTIHPELFLLLLSFELKEARRFMPCLLYRGGINPMAYFREAHFKNAKCSIYALFEVIRVLRRGTDIISHLSSHRRFTVSHVRRLESRLRHGKTTDADRENLHRINLTVYSLRKIVLNDIDRHDEVAGQAGRRWFARGSTDRETFQSFDILTYADAEYGSQVLDDWVDNAVNNLPVAGAVPSSPYTHSDIQVTRIDGAGKHQTDNLATYYGLNCKEVAIAASREVGLIIGRGCSGRLVARLANTIGQKLSVIGTIRSDSVDYMVKSLAYVFPPRGSLGHTYGFAASSWTDFDADAAKWKTLALGDANRKGLIKGKANPFAELFVETRNYLQSWSHGTSRMAHPEEAARIFCHLSHTCGLLSEEPIWMRLLQRQRLINGIKARGDDGPNQSGSFGRGPKSINRLHRLFA